MLSHTTIPMNNYRSSPKGHDLHEKDLHNKIITKLTSKWITKISILQNIQKALYKIAKMNEIYLILIFICTKRGHDALHRAEFAASNIIDVYELRNAHSLLNKLYQKILHA